MAINGITGYDYGQMAVQGIAAVDQTQQAAQAAQLASTGSAADQANFSQVSQLLSQLYQLQTTDPDKFKAVTQKISDDLASQAQHAGSSSDAAVLGVLSQRFEQISQSGDLASGVQTKRNGHHRHNGYGAGGQAKGGGIAELLGTVNTVLSTDLAALTASATTTATQAATTTAATTAAGATASAKA